MSRLLVLMVLLAAIASAQTCTMLTPSNCSNSIGPSGGPTLRAWITGLNTSLPATALNVAGTPQPKTILSGNVVFASQSYMVSDPATCPTSGICVYNNATVIDNWIDSLVTAPPNGVGLTSVDLNIWIGPLFESSQYLAGGLNYCGTYGTCYAGGAYAGWYAASLGTYDAMFAHLASAWPGVKVRVAPMISGDVMGVCGITHNSYTEAQVAACLVPAFAAAVKRWHVDDMTAWHENCGIAALVLGAATGNTNGCAMTIGDVDAFLTSMSVAIRATSKNASVRVGFGNLLSDAQGACPTGPASGYPAGNANAWCDLYTNLMPAGTIDFGGIDMYPVTSVPPASYGTTLANYATMVGNVTAISKPVVMNESSAMRWTNTSGASGEGGTYWGCAADEWRTDGSFMAWANAVPGAWAPANGVSIFSIMPIEELLMTTTDTANNHCTSGSTYETLLSQKLAAGKTVSPLGLQYAALAAGWNTSMQGTAHLSGVAHIGH